MPVTHREIEIVRPRQEPAFSERIEPLLASVRKPGWSRHIIVNLAGVEYLSSSNLTQLLKLRHAARVQDVHLRLTGASDQVMSEFVITSLDRVFEFAPNEKSAVESLEAEGA